MNRAQRRASGTVEKLPILEITLKHIDTYMPHVKNCDTIGIFGRKYIVEVVPEKFVEQVIH